MAAGEDVTVPGVREPDEFEAGHVPDAKLLPRGLLEPRSSEELPGKNARIVVRCASGGRGSPAAKTIGETGCASVADVEGGLDAWKEAGYEVA